MHKQGIFRSTGSRSSDKPALYRPGHLRKHECSWSCTIHNGCPSDNGDSCHAHHTSVAHMSHSSSLPWGNACLWGQAGHFGHPCLSHPESIGLHSNHPVSLPLFSSVSPSADPVPISPWAHLSTSHNVHQPDTWNN